MLLRRITKHVRDQNWFAVFLDFLIVVVGVFIGIQVANWNERLNEAKRAENYRERLIQEMKINNETLSGRIESFQQQRVFGKYAMEAITEPENKDEAWPIVLAYFQASHAFTISLHQGTYDEIINSGDLALINDQDLVNALSDFYSFSGFSTIQVIPDYRENVRRIIPFELQEYLHDKCYDVSINDIHHLLDCPPPVGPFDLVELAKELQSDQELRKDLRYMLSYAGVSGSIADNLSRRVDRILSLLSNSNQTKAD